MNDDNTLSLTSSLVYTALSIHILNKFVFKINNAYRNHINQKYPIQDNNFTAGIMSHILYQIFHIFHLRSDNKKLIGRYFNL